ncbi:MAG: mannose-1-phosphate guanylyltransferase/mannose-6-phosphate isomerase, partial [Alphaproteobacteria bacterium]
MARVVPVILSGGTGSRLWPLSRQSYPKQLLAFVSERTLLQEAVLRAADRELFEAPIVVANVEHRFVIAEQLRAIEVGDARVVLEPVGRNTAPAVAVAALLAARDDPDAIILVMPSDHVIADQPGFIAAVDAARSAAEAGALALFGVRPTRPESGYGYIRPGEPISDGSVVHLVASFVEKPDEATAIQYVAAGYLWNSGIFLLPARGVLDALAEHAPKILAAAEGAVATARSDLDFIRLGEAAFRSAPSLSIDRAVMERTHKAAVVPTVFGWSDAGTWTSLWDLSPQDNSGNVRHGESVLIDTKNSYVRSEGPLVATIGVSDLVVVATDDAVLVTSKGTDQRVSELVELLKQSGADVATESIWVHRPWGYYRSVHSGEGFQVKRITVNPGRRMSLQRHKHRAEHWVVVSGTALVTRDGEQFAVARNESV